jgi:hypothetical protein
MIYLLKEYLTMCKELDKISGLTIDPTEASRVESKNDIIQDSREIISRQIKHSQPLLYCLVVAWERLLTV